jgi:hypothetical protein
MLSAHSVKESKEISALINGEKSIIETKEIQDLLKLIMQLHLIKDLHNKKIWILLDFDNTLMETTTALGGDQWFNNLILICKTLISDKNLAVETAILMYHLVQHFVTAKTVEAKTSFVVNLLQSLGFNVLIITARDDCLKNPTFRQADAGKFDPSTNHDDMTHLFGTQPDNQGFYFGGTIFCSGKNKGKCLDAFLEKCTSIPDVFIMADDKKSHVEAIKETVQKRGKMFYGLHYTHLDDKVKQFDMKEANAQLPFLLPKLVEEINKKLAEQETIIINAKKEQEKLQAALGVFKHLCPTDMPMEAKHPEPVFEKDPLRPSKKRAFNEITYTSRHFKALDLAEPSQKKLKSGLSLKVDESHPLPALKF